MPDPRWSVYLVRCRDGTLYTGIATDVERRLREHQSSRRGAKFLRGKGPLTLVYQREIGNRSTATRVELAIKQLPRRSKTDRDTLSAWIDAALAGQDSRQ